MKKRKINKNKKNIIEEEIEEVEKWVIERRKFFIKLAWAAVIVVLLLLIGSLIDKIA